MLKPTWLIGIGAVAIIAIVLVAAMLGYIPGLNVSNPFDQGQDRPPGATYCDYTDMQILDMLETVTGKDLNNAVGISYVRALNMEACGSNDKTATEIATYSRNLNSDWHISDDDSASGSGWTAYRIVWLNSANASDATLARAFMIGEGITVESAYGYDTITITSDGPVLTYGAFMVWIASS